MYTSPLSVLIVNNKFTGLFAMTSKVFGVFMSIYAEARSNKVFSFQIDDVHQKNITKVLTTSSYSAVSFYSFIFVTKFVIIGTNFWSSLHKGGLKFVFEQK